MFCFGFEIGGNIFSSSTTISSKSSFLIKFLSSSKELPSKKSSIHEKELGINLDNVKILKFLPSSDTAILSLLLCLTM